MARRSDIPKLKFDICKIDTTRLRALNLEQLEAAEQRVGLVFAFSKRDEKSPRRTVACFISKLQQIRENEEPWFRPSMSNRYVDFKRLPERDQAEISQRDNISVDKLELTIWTIQAKKGCKINPIESIARDAIYERGDTKLAAEIRAQRRRSKIR
jgi:hypothetical protein